MTAIPPKIGPNSITRWWPNRSDSSPNTGDMISSAAKKVAVKIPIVVALTSGPPCSGRSAR